jgi:hypothetical protein
VEGGVIVIWWTLAALGTTFTISALIFWPWHRTRTVKHALTPWAWPGTGIGDETEGLWCDCGWITIGDRAQCTENAQQHLDQVDAPAPPANVVR